MTAVSYPGVYIQELQSSVRTITGVPTSITAFIGAASRGPIDEAITLNNFGDFERNFGGLSLRSSMSFAVRDFYLNGGGQAVIVRVHNGASAARITLSNATLDAASVGAWGARLTASVDHQTKDTTNTNLFNLTLQEVDLATKQVVATEKFLNVSVSKDDALFLPRVLEQRSRLARVALDSANNNAPLLGGTRPDVVSNAAPQVGSNGADGNAIGENDIVGQNFQTNKRGLFALEEADLFNLLCIPPFTLESDVSVGVLNAALAYCEKRRAMLLIDPPSAWTDVAKAVSGVDNVATRSANAALFFPRIVQPNPLRDGQTDTFAPCGVIAGVFARTDAQRGVWKAPAGQDALLVGVPELSVFLTDDENGQLNPLGVNCLRTFPVVGRVAWGSRTLEGADRLASQWKFVPVRRTALYIEETLFRGTKWVVFEPNDERLWAQIRLNIGAFMHGLFRQGAFQGTKARDAYMVKCDAETTTQDDINQGIVNVVVGFAPLKPAEFVIIKIQQLSGQIDA